jgi:hypothetical protein
MQPEAPNGRGLEIGEIADALPGIDPHDQRHNRILGRFEPGL